MNYSTAPLNYTDIKMDISALPFAGAVLFGSRALNANKSNADYDFAILHSNLNILLKEHEIALEFGRLENHFDFVPAYGDNYILKRISFNSQDTDLLVLEHQEHIDMIKKATEYVRANATPLLLKDKDIRLHLYRKGLKHSGFIKNTIWHRLGKKVKGLLWTLKNSKN